MPEVCLKFVCFAHISESLSFEVVDTKHDEKHGSSVVITLASRAKGTGINPKLRQGKHAFICVICRHDM